MMDLQTGDAGSGRNMDHSCLRMRRRSSRICAYDVKVGDIKTRYGAEGNGVSIYLTDPELSTTPRRR